MWQCKHADVCTYVRRVLINSRTLLEQVPEPSRKYLTMHSESTLKRRCLEFLFLSLLSHVFIPYHLNSFKGLLDRLILTTLDQSLNSSSSDAINSSKNINVTAKSTSKNTKYGDVNRSSNLSDNNSSSNTSYPTASSIQQSRVIDQISINVRANMKAKDVPGSEDNSLFYYVEDELRSSILQLLLLDVNMDKLPKSK